MNRRLISIVTAIALVSFAAPVVAATGTGSSFYVGAGIGNTFYSESFDIGDVGDEVQKIDENSTAWKIFGGFSGHQFLGIEGGYRDFGTIESDFGGETLKSSVNGWDIEALGRIQIAIIDVFAKAGVMFWSSDAEYAGEKFEDSGTNFLWGLGAGVHLGPIGVRLEWESLEQKDVDNLSVVSLGATLGF